MFINNIQDLTHTELFYCDKETSNFLQKNGFSLLSIYHGEYVYVLTDKLSDFINTHKKGGDVSNAT